MNCGGRSRGLLYCAQALLVASVLAEAASAQVIYEGFNYPAGTAMDTQNGGQNMAGSWARAASGDFGIEEGGLAFPGLLTTGNRAAVTTPGGNFGDRRLYDSGTFSSLVDGGDIWVSFLFKLGPTANLNVNPFVSSNGINQVLRFQLRASDQLVFAHFASGDRLESAAFTPGETVLFVAHMTVTGPSNDGQNDTLRVWLNPTPGAASPDTPMILDATFTFEQLPNAGVTFITEAAGSGVHVIDEYRVGGSFAAVTPPPDSDGDGLLDSEEIALGTDPLNPDSDGDGLSDGDEVNMYGTNPLLYDTDGDGLSDGEEVNIYGTDPLLYDTDGDGLSDGQEIAMQEFGCPDPLVPDSDGDGLLDGIEHMLGLNLCDGDTDGDGLSDWLEVHVYGTNPLLPDTDGDGLFDGTEVDMAQGSGCPSPTNADSDGDGISDGVEVEMGTDPCNADTDGDGVPDNEDDQPTVPGVSSGFIEENLRNLCDYVNGLGLEHFAAPNNNARKGRRNAMCNKLNAAANSVAEGDFESAHDQLQSLLLKLNDEGQPADWMVHVATDDAKTIVHDDVNLLAFLISLNL